MADIFISYAREDHATAHALAQWLEGQGWSVWWDRELIAGDEFDSRIAAALEAACAVIVLWSAEAIASRWHTRRSRQEDLRRLAAQAAVALSLALIQRASYVWPVVWLEMPPYGRSVLILFVGFEVVMAARAGGALAKRAVRMAWESVAMSAAFSCGLTGLDLIARSHFAQLAWQPAIGVHVLLWWLMLALCLAAYWTARLSTYRRRPLRLAEV